MPDTLRPAASRLERMDPAHKITAACGFAILVSQLATPAMAGLSCLLAGTVLLLDGIPDDSPESPRNGRNRISIRNRLLAVNIFFLFLWVTLPLGLSERPDTFASLGPLYFNRSGLRLALCITLKGNAIALALLALVDSSPASANARALLRLRVPQKLVTLLLLTHANLSLMRREAERLFRAAKLRGFVPSRSFRSLKTWAWLIAMLLVRSWIRSKRVSDAMKLRGFQGVFPLIETRGHTPRTAGSSLLMLGSLLVPAGMLAYEFYTGGRG